MFQTCTTEHLPSFLPFLGFPFNHLALPLFCTASGFVLLLRSLRLQGPFDVNFIVPYVHMSHDSPRLTVIPVVHVDTALTFL